MGDKDLCEYHECTEPAGTGEYHALLWTKRLCEPHAAEYMASELGSSEMVDFWIKADGGDPDPRFPYTFIVDCEAGA